MIFILQLNYTTALHVTHYSPTLMHRHCCVRALFLRVLPLIDVISIESPPKKQNCSIITKYAHVRSSALSGKYVNVYLPLVTTHKETRNELCYCRSIFSWAVFF